MAALVWYRDDPDPDDEPDDAEAFEIIFGDDDIFDDEDEGFKY